MTDEDLLSLLTFICDRFVGYVPEQKMLRYAIRDWETEMNHVYKGDKNGTE